MKESIKHELGKSEDKSYFDKADTKPADKPIAKAKAVAPKMVIPADGKVVAANPGYWVVTASDAIPPADAGVVFGRARSVIAWVVGSDTATPPYPVTARPFDPGIETVALVELDGSVIGLDDTHYASTDAWKAAVTAAAAPPPADDEPAA